VIPSVHDLTLARPSYMWLSQRRSAPCSH
jgi:hypothetical protein